MSDRERVVGLLVGRENTFPQPFIDTVNWEEWATLP